MSARILIVEDEGIIARDIQRELLNSGYEPVGIAVSGDEALALATSHRPDIVLMDINITGGMDGIETACRIREELGIAAIFLTAYATPEIVERSKRAKPLGYIVKPFDGQSLRSTIEVSLNQDHLQRQLAASERRFRALMESAHDAIITTNPAGVIVGWSPAAERLLGWTPSEAVGRPLRSVVPPPSDAEREGVCARILVVDPADFGRLVACRATRRDGQVIPVEVSLVKWSEDGEDRISAFLRDTTERTRLEQQLRQAQKMEVLGRLAGSVAHDFNNILSVINGTCDLALDAMPPDDPHHEAFTDILGAGERAAQLTQQLLTFSRRKSIDPDVVCVGELVDGATALLRRLVGKSVRLVVDVEPGRRDTVFLDRSQAEQVLLNLAVNARDAMPDGGTLTIRTDRHVEDGRPVVRLMVSDSGVGMDASVRARLFEPFFTTKAEGKGTGLGLATVYGIVSGSGGSIAVDSAPGQGATFVITWPVRERPTSAD